MFMQLDDLRCKIDELDTQLVELLAQRQQLTTAVGAYKKQTGKPIYDPEREASLIQKRRQLAEESSVSADLVEDLLRRIIRESYKSQHNTYFSVAPEYPIVVVGGKGALGGRFVDMFQRSGYQVATIDKDDWHSAKEVFSKAKLVLVSVPIQSTSAVISALQGLPKDCILADLTSLKSEPLITMLSTHSGPVLGMHPMFGPDVPNFVKQVMIVCEGRETEKCQWLIQQISAWGMVIQYDDAEQHDAAMELIQSMRHFTTYIYGRFLAKKNPDLDHLLRLSSPIYRLELAMTGRLFAQNSELYADIIYGAEHSTSLAEQFKQEVDAAYNELVSANKDAFQSAFAEVALWFGDKSQEFLQYSRSMLQTAHDARDIK